MSSKNQEKAIEVVKSVYDKHPEKNHCRENVRAMNDLITKWNCAKLADTEGNYYLGTRGSYIILTVTDSASKVAIILLNSCSFL